MANTVNYNLQKPAKGTQNWDTLVNGNFDIIDNQLGELNLRIDDIVNPLVITLSSNPTVAELGSTVNSIVFDWSYSTTITTQTFEGGAIAIGLRTFTYTTPVTANKTFTLSATTEGGSVKTKTLTLNFYNGIYYGKSSSTTYNSALINSLTKVLSDTKARTISVTANTGEYIYYCLPARLGTVSFKVNGFDGGFAKVATISFTNASGYAENYDIYRSDNANLGSTSVVIS